MNGEQSKTTKKFFEYGVPHFTFFVKNQVGALLDIVKYLKENKIEVLGLSVSNSVDIGMARMILSNPESARSLLTKNHFAFGYSELLVVELSGGASHLNKCLATLLLAEVNIDFSYTLFIEPNDLPLICFHTDDIEFAATILNQNNYKILSQYDLSR